MAVAIGRIQGRRWVVMPWADPAGNWVTGRATQFRARAVAESAAAQWWTRGKPWCRVTEVSPDEARENVRRGILVNDSSVADLARIARCDQSVMRRGIAQFVAEQRIERDREQRAAREKRTIAQDSAPPGNRLIAQDSAPPAPDSGKGAKAQDSAPEPPIE